MAGGTFLDLFTPPTAETVGTVRTQRIANEPYDDQIRNAGMSVIDAMLASAKDRIVEIASGTAAGQDIIRTATQQQVNAQVQRWGPAILIGILILVFFGGMMLRR